MDSFWARVQKTDGCWLWMAGKIKQGYGAAYLPGSSKQILAHRLAYVLCVGAIPVDMTIDHLCKNKACVRPEHLEAVSRAVNTMRGDSVPAKNARKTHCKAGHELTKENTYSFLNRNGKPNRVCKTCSKQHSREQWRVKI